MVLAFQVGNCFDFSSFTVVFFFKPGSNHFDSIYSMYIEISQIHWYTIVSVIQKVLIYLCTLWNVVKIYQSYNNVYYLKILENKLLTSVLSSISSGTPFSESEFNLSNRRYFRDVIIIFIFFILILLCRKCYKHDKTR